MTSLHASIESKLPNTGTTIFTVMSALANEYGAINLSQGFPDYNCSPRLISLVNHYMQKGFNQYAPMQGIISLREAIARKTETLYGAVVKPESDICITPGATEAIYCAITAMVHRSDEVIIFEPAYDCYAPAVQLSGGIPVPVSLKYPGFRFDWETVKNKITAKTRMIIINTPHNPTGAVLKKEDMLMLQHLISNTDIVIVSDEVYEHILFDNMMHESVLRYPLLAERSFAIFSFGKTYHTTGWKIGYCLAPKYLMDEFLKVHQYVTFTTNTPIQYAYAEFISDSSAYDTLSGFYQKKRDYFMELMKNSRFNFTPVEGTYFQLMDYSAITDEDDTDLAVRLTKEAGVASVPVSVFYTHPTQQRLLRFCFAKNDETLKQAAERLCRI